MYTIYFEDGTIFKGGTIGNSLWNQMPLKTIKKLEINLGKSVVLEGYELYNLVIEWVQFVNKAGRIPLKLMILGKIFEDVHIFTLNFQTKELSKITKKYGFEYQDKPLTGWKKGKFDNPRWYLTP